MHARYQYPPPGCMRAAVLTSRLAAVSRVLKARTYPGSARSWRDGGGGQPPGGNQTAAPAISPAAPTTSTVAVPDASTRRSVSKNLRSRAVRASSAGMSHSNWGSSKKATVSVSTMEGKSVSTAPRTGRIEGDAGPATPCSVRLPGCRTRPWQLANWANTPQLGGHGSVLDLTPLRYLEPLGGAARLTSRSAASRSPRARRSSRSAARTASRRRPTSASAAASAVRTSSASRCAAARARSARVRARRASSASRCARLRATAEAADDPSAGDPLPPGPFADSPSSTDLLRSLLAWRRRPVGALPIGSPDDSSDTAPGEGKPRPEYDRAPVSLPRRSSSAARGSKSAASSVASSSRSVDVPTPSAPSAAASSRAVLLSSPIRSRRARVSRRRASASKAACARLSASPSSSRRPTFRGRSRTRAFASHAAVVGLRRARRASASWESPAARAAFARASLAAMNSAGGRA